MPPVNLIRQLLMFHPGVPHRVRFWSIVLMAFCYQIVGGVYLASLSQMVGELGLLSEDLTMANYCSLIGLNVIFPMLFRWKFGLYTRQLFFVSAGVIIACSVAAPYATTPVAFWVISFVAGYFKMMGMFGCMSSIQLNITPTRNFAVFFPVIYVIVCSSIQLSGTLTTYVTYYTDWRMMHLVALVLMLIVEAIAYFLMRPDHRSGPPVPLKGIDWTGQALWTAVCGIAAWLFTYGEHYDWWESREIWQATWWLIAVLLVTLVYSHYKKEPYIALQAFGYRATWQLVVLLFGMTLFSGAVHLLQGTFLGGVLHYDALNTASLNLPEIAGIVMGAILAYFILMRWRWGVKRYLLLTFAMATYYVLSMYYLCDTATDKETMYLAVFAFGVAEVMMETMATYYLSQRIPFPHFFMNIAIIGFVRCGVGTAAGAALVHRLFHWSLTKQGMVVSEHLVVGTDGRVIADAMSKQPLLLALQESYGVLIVVGVLLMVIILLSHYRSTMTHFLPRLMAVRMWMTHRRTEDPMLEA